MKFPSLEDLICWWDRNSPTEKLEQLSVLRHLAYHWLEMKWEELPKYIQDTIILWTA